MIDWLVSYPRSGNTWLRLALWTLKSGRPATLDALGEFGRMAVSRHLLDTMLDCDSGLMTPGEIQKLRPRLHRVLAETRPGILIKVHDSWLRTSDRAPIHAPGITRRTIYLIRDPRDVAVSWARFSGRSIDAAIAFLADPDATIGATSGNIGLQLPMRVGSWSRNVASWVDESRLEPLVVRYEDMVADPSGALRAIAGYLEWPVTEATLAMAIDATRFDRLAAMEAKGGFAERPASADSFFRTGRPSGWTEDLDPRQAARIERDHREIMARFGYR